MKSVAQKGEHFVVDGSGQRVAVVLDIGSYQKLIDAAEDNADLRAYKAAKPTIDAQMARGDFTTIEEFRGKRSRRK
jgi:hypothetical protein